VNGDLLLTVSALGAAPSIGVGPEARPTLVGLVVLLLMTLCRTQVLA
jgi:hypothetical protein